MSGLEIAGAVLGSIPLVISAIEHYANGISTARRYLKYQTEMEDLLRKIRTEQKLFKNTIETLLNGIASDERMSDIVAGGNFWQEPDIELKLKDRLRDAYDIYLDNVCGMEASLQRFREKLALDQAGKPQFSDPSRFKENIRRLKFSVKRADYAEQVNALCYYNQALMQLTTQSISLENSRSAIKHHRCPNFNILQSLTRALYETLQSGLRCACDNHAVKLRLEKRKRRVSKIEDIQEASFRVIFTGAHHDISRRSDHGNPWRWAEANISRLPNDPPQMTEPTQIALKSPKQVRFVQPRNECSSSDITLVERSSAPIIKSMPIQIGDLCTAIAALPTPQPIACIGYLTDNSNRQYGIYPLDSANDSEKSSPTVYSLRQILTEYKSNNWRLRLSDKLQVALDLAFSVLQLYKTPWLDEQWSDSDVYFVRHPDAPAASLYEHPFVYRKISASKIDQASDNIGRPAAYRVIRNQTLFTLGILLIELCFEKSIEDLQLPCDLDCSNTPGVAWCTAQRLLDEKKLEFKIGPGYQDIVRRCIWCDFDQGKSNLDDRDLQRAVFEKVVVPLEEILQVLG